MACLERAMEHDALIREGRREVIEKEVSCAPCKNAEDLKTYKEIVAILVEHAGETGESESAVEVARRLSDYWKRRHDPERAAALSYLNGDILR